MKHNYIVIDDDYNSVVKTRSVAAGFQNLHFVASAANYDDGLDLILQHLPDIVFLEISPGKSHSRLSLHLINELHRYLKKIPKIIVTSKDNELALEALRYEVLDYFVKPVNARDLRRTMLRFEKNLGTAATPEPHSENLAQKIVDSPIIELPVVIEVPVQETIASGETVGPMVAYETAEAREENPPFVAYGTQQEKPLIICVKSYGDYRFIDATEICYLQADNNSTDIHLNNGEMITAFKTLKHFENVLTSPFVRIHNSYIVNIDYVSRIHTGNAVCYIKNTTTKLPFSKSYKENVDAILNSISNGNYLEI
ncbi:hypothetical protein FNO01nite_05240 [Flavobacterium noncentrifugens]|uniref:Two component transcriptional regulator, LytTR family n=1 Tax=Flavobacterium noncentrifugens TaxID=1128970 RepID=A0A1G8SIZ6_9FLAO|nr:LytTR family DNA-binding domain-containing protein [Flavobacterium noncentrifugens]GEP49852.1 hypothetical protein FNO01nite_05240 [Flavobacterium noncentrifugens]SDJ29216.1 two component transcriptional regulator, LytTR family [Flavobacterium noncentrifugens]